MSQAVFICPATEGSWVATTTAVSRPLSVSSNASTVCRAVKGKYVETPHGVFEFRIFFGGGRPDGISKAGILDRLRRLIRKEPRVRPWTDLALVGLLKGQGIEVSRRAVAKYRQELRVLPSSLRRTDS